MGNLMIPVLDDDKPLPSLKLTANAPENRPGPKRKVVFQPSIFRCYVSFREGTYRKNIYVAKDFYLPNISAFQDFPFG